MVDGDQMQGVLGKQVRSSTGEDMGRIVDVIIDKAARVRGAVIDFGGFLGVGNRQIAVAWNAFRPPPQNRPGTLVVDFTRDQLRVAPAYKAGEQVVLLGPTEASTPPAPPAAPPTPAAPAAAGASEKDSPAKEPPAKEPPSK
ncbi:PRC-barrel domain-containing protein [Bradyrhizobium sp. LHD-71]|uniref:PRC-barrel domain-containing protein n=1 Tax=Bradyrhizobium sp. LHD-71 TaxID=3072141 RepID=UPI00280C84B7|nr:PRC-barrel domain-containing protein [Bradyrhizobium sp. LHD-71]MDQ8729748.1 PRC-barrel domain-containing protein [Bradyrhizobium sp. LHD-71]